MKINCCCFDFLQFCWWKSPQENDLAEPINPTAASLYDPQARKTDLKIQEWAERVWMERTDPSPTDSQVLEKAIQHVRKNLSFFGLPSSSNCGDESSHGEREDTPLMQGPKGCRVRSLAGIDSQPPDQCSVFLLMAQIEANEVLTRARLRETEFCRRESLTQRFRDHAPSPPLFELEMEE